ncbi:DUF3302 domain-containing protein [Shewanella sp. 10N.286.45.A1]|uniref:DUF3302 domain-containing protein n=1 Tax=Shewanella sp. 10N.286.45.A1 TaxID=3229694 RepID=UPI00354BE6DB
MNLVLDYASLGILMLVILILIYGLIAIHDIPYEIAKKRNHPQQEAIHVTGWISLFFMHALWPLLWVWAMYYDPKTQGEAVRGLTLAEQQNLQLQLDTLKASVTALQSKEGAL